MVVVQASDEPQPQYIPSPPPAKRNDSWPVEGVRGQSYRYPLHHLRETPELPGSDQANATTIALPYFTSDQPELVEQYAHAFEKVWAHRSELS